MRDLRRVLVIMVMAGFGLNDVRKLYIDELDFFYLELVGEMEERGQIKTGTYAKIKRRNGGAKSEDTVGLLRRQMFQSIADKNKKR